MTNRLAIIMGLLIVGGVLWDVTRTDGANLLFLMKKLAEFIEWLAFWR
ncbi:MAG: hypothetical protein AAGF60_00365 [Pseudomonadota bacterium]